MHGARKQLPLVDQSPFLQLVPFHSFREAEGCCSAQEEDSSLQNEVSDGPGYQLPLNSAYKSPCFPRIVFVPTTHRPMAIMTLHRNIKDQMCDPCSLCPDSEKNGVGISYPKHVHSFGLCHTSRPLIGSHPVSPQPYQNFPSGSGSFQK